MKAREARQRERECGFQEEMKMLEVIEVNEGREYKGLRQTEERKQRRSGHGEGAGRDRKSEKWGVHKGGFEGTSLLVI